MSMDDVILEQINATQEELAQSTSVSMNRKDSLIVRLAHAKKCGTGSSEDIGKAVAFLLVDSVRSDIRSFKEHECMINEHVRTLHAQTTPKSLRELGQYVVSHYPMLVLMASILIIDKIGVDKFNAILAMFTK